MDKLAILKISGIVLVSFIVMLAAAFFLYPKLNKKKYEEVVSNFEKKQQEASQLVPVIEDTLYENRKYEAREQVVIDTALVQTDSDSLSYSQDIAETVGEEIGATMLPIYSSLRGINEIRMQAKIDSLELVVAGLESELENKNELLLTSQNENTEEFATRVKSLLNLEEDELAPILEKMSNDQVVRLYYGGGTIQREKILRSLKSDKAAEIMTEIM